MLHGSIEAVWVGFVIAGIGFYALNYANVRIRPQEPNRGLRNPLGAGYWSVVRQQVGRWPIYTAAICIPTGIIITFGALIYNSHLKLR